MRTFGVLSLASIVAAGILALFAALQEWWAISFLCVFLALFATACLVLLSVRSIKWQMVSDLKKSRNETREVLNLLQQVNKQHQGNLSSMTVEHKQLRDQQEDSFVVVQSAIGNLNTRVQQLVDSGREPHSALGARDHEG